MRPGAAVLAALLLAGCARGKRPAEVLVESAKTFVPEANPGSAATLRLGPRPRADGKPVKGMVATEFDVSLERSQVGREVTLLLRTQGETIEREIYEIGDSSFRVLRAGDDAFVPGIDLLHFPTRNGDIWSWQGKVLYAGISRPAHAEVSISKEGADVRSGVRLFMGVDANRPEVERNLTFWLRQSKGVIQRSFSDVSSRRPTEEPWHP